MDDREVLRRLQVTELEILNAFSSFCAEHNLNWFIDGGTLLGARRHGGFIPWDDDIDVGMLREDYDKFVSLALDCFPSGYSVHTPESTPGLAGMFAKIYKDGTVFETAETRSAHLKQGIFIDIFPYDYLSIDDKVQLRQRRNARIWQSISYLYHSPVVNVPHKGFLAVIERSACCIAHGLARLFLNPQLILNWFNASRLTNGMDKRSQRVLPFAWPQMEGIPLDYLTTLESIEFEGISFPCPCNTDKYLSLMYGDWKTLPAPEDRKTHLPLRVCFSDGLEWVAS